MTRTYCHDCYNYHDSVVCPHKDIPFCPDCQKYHAKGKCEMNLYICKKCGRHHSEGLCPARTIPQYPTRQLHKLSSAMEEWTAVYERNLHEFATETGGVPTPQMVLRAQELADREIKLLFQRT